MPLVLKHQTAAEFIARFREAYRNADRERMAQLAKWLLARIAAGDITDAQVRNTFGLNVQQWNNKKTLLEDLVAKYDAVQAAQGD